MSDSVDKLLPKRLKLTAFQLLPQLLPVVSHVLQVGFPGHNPTQRAHLLVDPALHRLNRAVERRLVALALHYVLDVDLADLVDGGVDDHLLVSLLLQRLIEHLQLHLPLHRDLRTLDVPDYLTHPFVHVSLVILDPCFLCGCLLRLLLQRHLQ